MTASRIKWCRRSAFQLPLFYTAVFTERAFHREMRRLGVPQGSATFLNPNADATTQFFHNPDKGEIAIVCMPDTHDKDGIQIACLLVHEAVHIWQHACRILGETQPSDEFEAYNIQTISQELMDLYASGANRK